MKISTISFVCMMFLIGCTSSYTVGTKGSGADYDYEQFNNHIEKHNCIVLLTTKEEKKVNDIIASEDSISYTLLTKIKISMPKFQVSQIQPAMEGRINEKFISFKNGRTKVVDSISFTSDSISWMEPSMIKVSLPTSQITKITYINHARGFGEGLWKGTLVGLLVGGATEGAFSNSDVPGGVIGLIFGGVTLLVSPVAGAIYGHTEVFQLQTH